MFLSFEKINDLLDLNINYSSDRQSIINDKRDVNFDSELSESIVALILEHNCYKPINKPKSGDLLFGNIKIEVKCYSSLGPSSFGPDERWNWICFLNASKWKIKYFECYLIKLSNDSDIWYNIKVNEKETFYDQAQQKRRPRIAFDKLKLQIPNDKIEEIFHGYINDLGIHNIFTSIMEKKYTLIDLFAGTGAFSYAGLKTGKIKPVYSNDIESSSKTIYDLNMNHELNLSNIHDINIDDIPEADILTAGFPCQPFSLAGKKLGFDDNRSNVIWKLLNIIKYKTPRIVILENVKNLLTIDNGIPFKTICKKIQKMGYFIKHDVLSTNEYTDIPHGRERIYIVCFKYQIDYDNFTFPPKITYTKPIGQLIDPVVSNDYFYDNRYKDFDNIKEQMKYSYLDNKVYQYRRGIVRENKSGVCPTLTANMGTGGHNVPLIKYPDGRIRKLTPRECFRLQGFDDSYLFPAIGNMNDNRLYKLAGNAVTMILVKRILDNVIKVLDKNKIILFDDVKKRINNLMKYNNIKLISKELQKEINSIHNLVIKL